MTSTKTQNRCLNTNRLSPYNGFDGHISVSRNLTESQTLRGYLVAIPLTISWQVLAHSRHSLAQAAISLSSAIFSQAAAHSSQHLAQHSHAGTDSTL